MEFAISGLLACSQMANGQPADARRTIEVLRECFAERGLTRFLPNMDAMLCFIRTVSVYGTAVLPLLEALDWDGDKAWRKRLMAAVRTQAAFYPHFLEPRLAPGEELTPT